MNMGGMGTSMMKSLMKKKNVASLEQMMEMAAELDVKIYVCEMSMDLMGFKREEIIDYPGHGLLRRGQVFGRCYSSRITLLL